MEGEIDYKQALRILDRNKRRGDMKDLEIGEKGEYYGYPISREEEDEYCVRIYADDLIGIQTIIKRCMEEGIIEWPIEITGRASREKA